jgi:hypothetical protein
MHVYHDLQFHNTLFGNMQIVNVTLFIMDYRHYILTCKYVFFFLGNNELYMIMEMCFNIPFNFQMM